VKYLRQSARNMDLSAIVMGEYSVIPFHIGINSNSSEIGMYLKTETS